MLKEKETKPKEKEKKEITFYFSKLMMNTHEIHDSSI
jgi:hypothetical protein